MDNMYTSTLVMVDLAGSERVKASGAMYQRLEETKVFTASSNGGI